jgi:4-diphosphocytidyl-2-C-methyl-D-erythritol kinase
MGADVPYFLEGGTALGRSRGDRLSRLDDGPRAWVVLTVPRFGVSTREAFGWWDREVGPVGPAGPVGRAGKGRQARQAGRAGQEFSNDLQPVVARRHPVVATLVAALERAGAFQASLSGSGSAVFGLFARQSQAERAARALRQRAPRRLVLVTRTLTRRECAALAAK